MSLWYTHALVWRKPHKDSTSQSVKGIVFRRLHLRPTNKKRGAQNPQMWDKPGLLLCLWKWIIILVIMFFNFVFLIVRYKPIVWGCVIFCYIPTHGTIYCQQLTAVPASSQQNDRPPCLSLRQQAKTNGEACLYLVPGKGWILRPHLLRGGISTLICLLMKKHWLPMVFFSDMTRWLIYPWRMMAVACHWS